MDKLQLCEFCGHEIPKIWGKHQRFCCDACRRGYQNERRKEQRLLARERKEQTQWASDPWAWDNADDLDLGLFSIDGLPVEGSMMEDQCAHCKYYQLKQRDLFCFVCREGYPL